MRTFLLVSLLFSPALLPAQEATVVPAGAAASASASDRALAGMRSALRHLVVAQETFFADSMTYTSNVARLTRAVPDTASGVTLEILSAGKRGWRGAATHRDLPGRSCVIAIGPEGQMPATQAGKLQPTPEQEGEVICDTP